MCLRKRCPVLWLDSCTPGSMSCEQSPGWILAPTRPLARRHSARHTLLSCASFPTPTKMPRLCLGEIPQLSHASIRSSWALHQPTVCFLQKGMGVGKLRPSRGNYGWPAGGRPVSQGPFGPVAQWSLQRHWSRRRLGWSPAGMTSSHLISSVSPLWSLCS